MAKSKSFEESMAKLEKLAKELEDENTGLEKSIEQFEEGVKLINECREALLNARQRITKILENGDETNLEIKGE